jgi:hypothetical protein
LEQYFAYLWSGNLYKPNIIKEFVMRKLLLLVFCVAVSYAANAQEKSVKQDGETKVMFRFLPEDDLFMRAGNEAELERLTAFINENGTAIRNGDMGTFVTGYSAGMPTEEGNLASARNRSLQVKSYMITECCLVEDDFTTRNFATAYNSEYQSAVTVEFDYLISIAPAPVEEPEEVVVIEDLEEAEPVVEEEEPVVVEVIEVVEEPAPAPAPAPESEWRDSYCFAVRGNVLYWAGALPTLGIEWRINDRFGIKVDGSFSGWDMGQQNRSHNILMVSPEIRYYMGQQRRFYLGLGGNIGQADMAWVPFSGLFTKNQGYDGNFYGGGLVVGYQVRLANRLSLDLNLGLGGTHYEYEIYDVDTDATINADASREFWGPTQAGVTLVWRIGGNK